MPPAVAVAAVLLAVLLTTTPASVVGQQEVVELDSCAEAQQALEEYLAAAPAGPRNACHGSVGAEGGGGELDPQQIQTTPTCAQWSGKCAANETVSECSVGCERVAGCRIQPLAPALAQPDHPHGEDAAGVAGRCVPDEAQCVCPDVMRPLVETMYWSCPSPYTSGHHWELSKPRWKAVVESWGCNGASKNGAPVRWALLAMLLALSCGLRR
jgi:hypothetical protein